MAIIPYVGKADNEKSTNQAYTGGSPVQIRTGEAGLFKIQNLEYHEDGSVSGDIVTGPIISESIKNAIADGRCLLTWYRRDTSWRTHSREKSGRTRWRSYGDMTSFAIIQEGVTHFELPKPLIYKNCYYSAMWNGETPYMYVRLGICFANYQEGDTYGQRYEFLTLRGTERILYYPEVVDYSL